MRKLPRTILQKITTKITSLCENPFPTDVIKIRMIDGYRIRVGNWRILYEIDQSRRTITVVAVRHRSKAYK